MKLKTQPFRDFFAYTKAMKPNTILPVYGYIKMTETSLEKSNGQAYCRMPLEGGTELMIEESEIRTFINSCIEPEFELTVSGSEITLTSGKLSISFDTIPAEDFPTEPSFDTEATPIDTSKLFTASKYADPKQINWMQCVVSDNNGIIGSDGVSLFYYDLPSSEMVLTIESCAIIAGLQDVKHASTDSHAFFFNDDVFYAFNKSSYSNVRYMHVVERVSPEGFIVKKSDLLLFCDTTIPRSDKACTLIGKGGNILMKLNDKDKNKKSELEVEIDGTCEAEFNFYAAKLAAAIRPLPYEKLRLHVNGHLSITSPEDPKYKGILTQIIL
jgi:hypothetical protein